MTSQPLHLINARIWTDDALRPWTHSLSIVDGRIRAVDPDPRDMQGVVIDAQQHIISPGLIDSHLHLLQAGQSLDRVDLSVVRSRDEFQAVIAHAHESLPPDRWLIAIGWSQENWPGGAMPSRSWLNCAGARPTVCYRMDMHAAVVNDPVLRMIDGTPHIDGLLVEADLWKNVNPLVPKSTAEERCEHLLRAQAHAHALGLTAVGSMEYSRDVNDAYVPMRDELTLRARITLLDRDWPVDISEALRFEGCDHLAIIGFKTFIDGTLGSRTARMLRDYDDDPGNRGMLVELAASGHLHDWMGLITGHGLSPSMHAIGDEAVRIALDAMDHLNHRPSVLSPPRIEHAQHIDPLDLPRFQGRIASMQPLHKADDGRYIHKRLGNERAMSAFPFRELLDHGAILAFGSDWPVVSCDPLLGIRTAVTGLTFDGEVFGPHQNISIEEAMRAYTSGAAHALGMNDAGMIRTGAFGDLVMFDRDPFTSDWAGQPPRIIMTIAGGEVVYDARDAKTTCRGPAKHKAAIDAPR